MPGIQSTGRRGGTIVPNWRWEDQSLDCYQLRIAGWLVSNTEGFTEDHVTRNRIAKATGISQGKVSSSIDVLAGLGIIDVETVKVRQSEGGRRWVITVHLDAWEARSRDDHPPVTGRPPPGHGTTTSIGYVVEKNREVSSSDSRLSVAHDAEFQQFWMVYGNLAGTGRRKAVECWKNALKRGAEPADIIAGLAAWVAYWRSDGANKAMYAQGFLNQEKWTVPPPPLPTPQNGALARVAANRGTINRLANGNLTDPFALHGGTPHELD